MAVDNKSSQKKKRNDRLPQGTRLDNRLFFIDMIVYIFYLIV